MIEKISRSVLVLTTFIFGVSLDLLATLDKWPTPITFIILLITFGIPLSVFDIRHHRLPNVLTGALFLSSLGAAITSSILHHEKHHLVLSFCGAIAMTAFYLLLTLLSGGGLGMGDVKLAAPLGLISGFFGLQAIWITNFIAIFVGAIFAIGLLIFARAGVKSVIPFGPFMLFGQLLCLILLTPQQLQQISHIFLNG